MANKQIILVEDERDMADLVAMRLRREHYDVEVAHDGETGLKLVRRNPPDLVLLDLMLPKLSGTEVAAQLKNDPATANVPIIMLTAKSEESDVVVGLRIGADDYVTKPFSLSVLLARVAAVLRRSEQVSDTSQEVLTVGPIRIDRQRHVVSVDDRPISLTLTEFKILAAIVAARGRVLSRDQLIDKALGTDAVVTDRTIDVHVTAVRRKLGKARRYIHTVRGVGYNLAGDQDETA